MSSPYVISGELEGAHLGFLNEGALDDFRTSLVDELTEMGKTVHWVEYATIAGELGKEIQKESRPIISIDDRYVKEEDVDEHLGISRAIDFINGGTTYDPRVGYDPLSIQLDRLGKRFFGQEVVVVDDVIFTGDNMQWVCEELARRNVRVGGILCGIAINPDSLPEKLQLRQDQLTFVRTFEEVDDEVCERDFTFVPGSGRKHVGNNLFSLYFDPVNGKPTEWASIPEEFSDKFFISSLVRGLNLLQPSVDMRHIGAFYGYPSTGNAHEIIKQKLDS
jgi:hypothetical protein